MNHATDMISHITAFVTPIVEHWVGREIAKWVHHKELIRPPRTLYHGATSRPFTKNEFGLEPQIPTKHVPNSAPQLLWLVLIDIYTFSQNFDIIKLFYINFNTTFKT